MQTVYGLLTTTYGMCSDPPSCCLLTRKGIIAKRHVTAYSLFGEQHRHEPHALVCKAMAIWTLLLLLQLLGFFPTGF